jgi:hypothetical protein
MNCLSIWKCLEDPLEQGRLMCEQDNSQRCGVSNEMGNFQPGSMLSANIGRGDLSFGNDIDVF